MARVDWNRPPLPPLEEGVKRYALTVSYDGRAFNGWQRQKNGVGVEQAIEKALFKMLGDDIRIIGAGRTDSGVHALGQVCHFDTTHLNIPSYAYLNVLNCKLPPTVRILKCVEVDGSFHSRYSAYAREYKYYFKRENEMTASDNGFISKAKKLPDLDLLNSFAKCLQGTHDFTTFTSVGDVSPSKCRDIFESYWSMEKDKWGYDVLVYTICGNAFLYKMVRSIVGTQMVYAYKKKSVEEFKEALLSKNRKKAETTASPNGLFLYRISYDEDEYRWFEETAIPVGSLQDGELK
jgi:tRNA pseudouridine38-40 synthase